MNKSLDPPMWLSQTAAWCAFTSGVVSAVGIVFLVAFYATFNGSLGTLNDIAVATQYALMLPIAFVLHQMLRIRGHTASLATLFLGFTGMLAVIILQVLLVIGAIPFEQQISMVIIGFLVVLAWFVMIWRLGSSAVGLPGGMLLHVLAGLYFGYPLWAFLLGRRLRNRERGEKDGSIQI